MGSRSMSLEQVSISAILILLLPALGLCGYRPVLPKEDVDRVSVTLPASPRVILRDTPRDNHDKDDGRRVGRRRVNDIAIILENFDKPALRSLLINKEKRVGDVILVNGKPAIIRKRRVGPSDEDDIASDHLLKVKKTDVFGGKPQRKKLRVRIVNKGTSLREKVIKAKKNRATKKPQLKRRKMLRKRLNFVL